MLVLYPIVREDGKGRVMEGNQGKNRREEKVLLRTKWRDVNDLEQKTNDFRKGKITIIKN